ncbi:MAG: hypothetical protein JWN77_1116 [Frankiales bacterium]|jgi:putative membrane protein|nr:hypothetical protein [Frankiales bacterium]
MSLAAERTYLAYVRTALALLAAGVAVATALPDAGAVELRRAMGLLMVLAGAAVAAAARSRYRVVDGAMRRGEPLPQGRVMLPLTACLLLSAVGACLVVLPA